MSMPLMKLGPHIFYVPNPDIDTPNFESVSRDTNFNIPSQGRLSRDPAHQFTGMGEDVMTIEGRLFPHHFGGEATLHGIIQSGRAGQPLRLVRYYPLQGAHAGIDCGKWLIRRVRKGHSKIGVTGAAHKIDFTLELVAYGDDRIADTGGSGGAGGGVIDFQFT